MKTSSEINYENASAAGLLKTRESLFYMHALNKGDGVPSAFLSSLNFVCSSSALYNTFMYDVPNSCAQCALVGKNSSRRPNKNGTSRVIYRDNYHAAAIAPATRAFLSIVSISLWRHIFIHPGDMSAPLNCMRYFTANVIICCLGNLLTRTGMVLFVYLKLYGASVRGFIRRPIKRNALIQCTDVYCFRFGFTRKN
jgi:hypothetical protein